MVKILDLDAEDACTLVILREHLRQVREERKISAHSLSKKVGRGGEFVSDLEKGRARTPRLSTLQLWASGLDLRIEFGLRDFWLMSHVDREMLTMFTMSRAWGSGDEFMRRWLVLALRTWRVRRSIDVVTLAPQLCTDNSSVWRWEEDSHDPFIARAMSQARFTGTRVTVSVWSQPDWIFE